ncbi:MAG: Bacillopeptidase F [Calditrichaeota bacterium]|nr:Bacillopeptidase F [Calditrichota bacterium]
MRIVSIVIPAVLAASLAGAQVIEESGPLRGFLAGQCPGAAYDNWVSHVVEGVASPGYNDYGPPELDPQADGFGEFRVIPNTPAGDLTLQHWRAAFTAFLDGEIETAAALLADSSDTFRYDAVIFHDSEFGRDYLILREQLDESFVDDFGTPGDPNDDVVGSFRNGWGVFILNLDASRENALVQAVHPADDFIAPHVAIELFFELDAGALQINGAGREVAWTNEGEYANGKSLSDPSRNPRHPMQLFHEQFSARFADQYPHQAQVLQIHSFDPSHELATSIVISAGYYRSLPYMPLRDVRREGRDIVHSTAHPVFDAGDWVGDSGPLPALPVNQYYAVHSDAPYYVYVGADDSLLVPQATTLRGDPDNRQAVFLHEENDFHAGQALEPFFHAEMDEYPAYLEDGDVPRLDLFNTDIFPPEFATYGPMLDFFQPFVTAIAGWFEWLDEPVSAAGPPQLAGLDIEANGTGEIGVSWPVARDGHMLTYEIVADVNPPNDNSPVVWTQEDDPRLRVIGWDGQTFLDALPEGQSYWVAARMRDLSGNAGALSPALPVTVEDNEGVELEVNEFARFPVSAWPAWICCRPLQDDIGSITAFWRVNGIVIDSLALEPVGGRGAWAAPLPEDVGVQPGDMLRWRIRTIDESLSGNTLYYPDVGWYEAELDQSECELTAHDFEQVDPSLVFSGDWDRGEPAFGPDGAHSGEYVVATRPDGPYLAAEPASFLTGEIVLPEYGPLLLVYWQWLEYEEGDIPGTAVDGGRIRTGELDFDEVAPEGGYTHRIAPDGFEDARSVFSGTTPGWQPVVVDLRAGYGVPAYLEFSSETSGETGLAGWYLDDLRLAREVNLAPPQPFALTSPEDGASVQGETVAFAWEASADGDPYAFPAHTLHIDAQFDTLTFAAGTASEWPVNLAALDLLENGPPQFHWWVVAVSQGDTVASDEMWTLLNPFSAVDAGEGSLPREFALTDVWPNPFNASLSLRYELPEAANVRAALYNVLGQRVATIVDTRREPGSHRLSWRAHELASGIYLLRFSAGEYETARKLLLIK